MPRTEAQQCAASEAMSPGSLADGGKQIQTKRRASQAGLFSCSGIWN